MCRLQEFQALFHLFPFDMVPWGGGITETTIMDTWTKSMGRVKLGEADGFYWVVVE